MAKQLILTEKVDAGCQVAEALYHLGSKSGDFGTAWSEIKKKSARKGYLVGGDYVIVWTNGHLGVDLKPSEINIGNKLNFSFDSNYDYEFPSLLSSMKRVVKKEKKSLASLLKTMIKDNNFSKAYICTDADAEGERIARDALFSFGGLDKNCDVRRMWVTGAFNTPKIIEKELKSALKYDSDKYAWLYDSQLTRSTGDFIQGMKPTKALVDCYGLKLYSGRVKNTMIGLIGDRFLEIKNFKSKEYYIINSIGNFKLSHFYYKDVEDVDSDGKLVTKKTRTTQYFNKEDKDRVVKELRDVDLKGKVTQIESSTSSSKTRPLPLSGDDFKSEMATTHKISLDEAGMILQYLRDEGFTTYQGTNGRFFSKDEEEIVNIAYNTAVNVFSDDKTTASAKFTLSAYLFNDSKAKKQNHPPLHLTEKIPSVADYIKWENSKFKKVKEGYLLIAKRILVSFLEADKYETVKLEVEVNKHKFDTSGVKPLVQGWREFIGDKKANTYFDVDLKKDDDIKLDDIEIVPKKTTVSKPYNEVDLLKIFLNVSKVLNSMIDDEEDPTRKLELKKAKNILKNVEGIGTDRTRGMIFAETIKVGLVEVLKSKDLQLSSNGWVMYNALPPKLRSVVFTALWEEDFEEIRRGNKTYKQVIENIDEQVKESVKYIITNVDKSKVNVIKKLVKVTTDFICPVCQSTIVETENSFSCSKRKYQDKKVSGCKFIFGRNQKKLDEIISKDSFEKILNNEVYVGKNGNKISLDLESDYFSKIDYHEDYKNTDFYETAKSFRLGEKFVFKNIFGANLTKIQAKAILEGKKVLLKRKGKTSKKAFKVKVWLGENGSCEHVFA